MVANTTCNAHLVSLYNAKYIIKFSTNISVIECMARKYNMHAFNGHLLILYKLRVCLIRFMGFHTRNGDQNYS